MPFVSITGICRQRLTAHLRAGDQALDGTAGNGHDTVTLARAVGPTGLIWAIDCQSTAIASTRHRLQQEGLTRRVHLLHGDHADLAQLLPDQARGMLAAAVFNLGYLPGGDHSVATREDSTLRALEATWDWLRPAGALLAVVCYPGHPQGAPEARAVVSWAASIQRHGQLEKISPPATQRPAPFLLCLRR